VDMLADWAVDSRIKVACGYAGRLGGWFTY